MTHVSTVETENVPKKSETANEHEKPRDKKERVRLPTKVNTLKCIHENKRDARMYRSV